MAADLMGLGFTEGEARSAFRYAKIGFNVHHPLLESVGRALRPVMRWLFEYSRDNFERQRRVNDVLFACVQELAIETARLRQELDARR